jgi:hypothetical protein
MNKQPKAAKKIADQNTSSAILEPSIDGQMAEHNTNTKPFFDCYCGKVVDSQNGFKRHLRETPCRMIELCSRIKNLL